MISDTDWRYRVGPSIAYTVSNLSHAVQTQLTQGQPFIRLKSFTTTEYSDTSTRGKDDTRRKPGIVIVQYEFLCRPLLDVNPDVEQAYMVDDEEDPAVTITFRLCRRNTKAIAGNIIYTKECSKQLL